MNNLISALLGMMFAATLMYAMKPPPCEINDKVLSELHEQSLSNGQSVDAKLSALTAAMQALHELPQDKQEQLKVIQRYQDLSTELVGKIKKLDDYPCVQKQGVGKQSTDSGQTQYTKDNVANPGGTDKAGIADPLGVALYPGLGLGIGKQDSYSPWGLSTSPVFYGDLVVYGGLQYDSQHAIPPTLHVTPIPRSAALFGSGLAVLLARKYRA